MEPTHRSHPIHSHLTRNYSSYYTLRKRHVRFIVHFLVHSLFMVHFLVRSHFIVHFLVHSHFIVPYYTLLKRQLAPECSRSYTATHCNTLQHTATHCNTLLSSRLNVLKVSGTVIHYSSELHSQKSAHYWICERMALDRKNTAMYRNAIIMPFWLQ